MERTTYLKIKLSFISSVSNSLKDCEVLGDDFGG